MFKSLPVAGLVVALLSPASAKPPVCDRTSCAVALSFSSVSEERSYGILIAAPDQGCRHVRFRVEGGGRFLGQTPPLGPGELAVVRLGTGFATGKTRLLIAPVGCNQPPAAALRVVLAKVAPDHGWRASRELALR